MLFQEPQLAPVTELVRYLAVFQRAFAVIEEYTRDNDKPGMLLSGYLANALHNVPAMLWHYSAKGWHTPAQTDAYLQGFPGQMQRYGAPERLVEASRQIVSSTGTAQELGLQEDLADVDLAPLPKMREYLNLLYEACVNMRVMRNYGSRPVDRLWRPWRDLERVWNAEADAQANYYGEMATILRVVPQELVQWGHFDEPRFHAAYLSMLNKYKSENATHDSSDKTL